ncbi:arsenate-mycothiol transferase [Geodermatophilus obscurus]|uniref:Arsenate-mycothiol transferase n=1 Tax=Geodermatophilus obscurus TaxID=1861 RepID=A0A1M7UYJ6_9ACTN|nr:low molecular weight phosphatase family protein [Geodermatophilus obscurus]SHN88007.1 arsenate-mycothiol transferase [Geodermatophilus obscurus]
MSDRPKVLFVRVKNAGKSQVAAGLMKQLAGDTVDVSSTGTRAGTALNELSVQSLAEIGIDIAAEHPKPITDEMIQAADVVITLGSEAHIEPVDGARFGQWVTDEPSERGIDGIARMRLVRDDIDRNVRELAQQLGATVREDLRPHDGQVGERTGT